MKNKLISLLTLSLAVVGLASCDDLIGGDEEIDANLYELKLTTNLDKAKENIRAEFGGVRDNDEVEELKQAGATQEDIDKAGTCVDGTYYFFDQDGIKLYEPFIPGYEFLGWYNGTEHLGYLDTNYDGNPEYLWNMPNKNTTLEARFKLMKFDILYMDEGTATVDSAGNPTTWNIEQGEVVLKHTDKTSQGLEWKGYTFAMGGDTHYDGYVTKLNEQFLIDSNIAKQSLEGRDTMTFSLHENYGIIEDSFKITYSKETVDNVFIEVKEPGENVFRDLIDGKHWITEGEAQATLPRGTEIQVQARAIDSDTYEVDGIYCGDQKISTEVSGLHCFTLSGNCDCEIRVKTVSA